jgi:hypothetical protein
VRRLWLIVVVLGLTGCLAGGLAGCGWFGGKKSNAKQVSVFSAKPGQCFVAPKDVKAELSKLSRIDCSQPHTQETYAVLPYTATSSASASASAYPGNDVLATFAQGACAQRYRAYVGVDYLDSRLFFTYLLPSARSWEQDSDRNVICFVTTTGAQLTSSVKGSKQ